MNKNATMEDYCRFLDEQRISSLPRWDDLPEIELYMDQVITYLNKYVIYFSTDNEAPLTSSMINNYVKHGIIPSPVKKKYNKIHLSRLLIICALKSVLSISHISEMINHLLTSNSDQQLHDFFVAHFERTFDRSLKILKEYTRRLSNDEDLDIILSMTTLHAASTSCAGKFLAVNTIVEQKRRKTEQITESDMDNKKDKISNE